MSHHTTDGRAGGANALIRSNPAAPLLLLLCVAAATTNLVAARGLTFFGDDWDFVIKRPGWDITTFLRPHNEHLSAAPIFVFKVIGLVAHGAYWPYLVALQVHLALAAIAVYWVAERHAGAVWGVAAAGLLLFFGAGAENMVWAFQIGMVGSAAAGLAALAVVDRSGGSRAAIAAAILLLLALLYSGLGVVYLAAVMVRVLLDPARRNTAPVLLLPAVAYAAWYLSYGRGFSRPALTSNFPQYVATGLSNSMAAILGAAPNSSPLFLVLLVALIAFVVARRGASVSLWIALAGALVLEFALSGAVRWCLGPAESAAPRYMWAAGTLLLPFVSVFASTIGRNRMMLTLMVAVLALSVGGNLTRYAHVLNDRYQLRAQAAYYKELAMTSAPACP